jgi:hypothetical protein
VFTATKKFLRGKLIFRLAVSVLKDAFEHFRCEIQSEELRRLRYIVRAFEPAYHVDTVLIVIEASKFLVNLIEQLMHSMFASMTKRSMAYVMSQRARLNKITV